MSRKFGHEKLNRQEKAWKEPAGCVGGKESTGLWQFLVTPDDEVHLHLNHTVADQMSKVEVMEAFKREVYRMRFIVSGYKFMFSHSLKQFADANSLAVERAAKEFKNIRPVANERLRMVMGRVRRTIETRYEHDDAGHTMKVYTLSYHALSEFLQLDTED
jgi:hypothetical protein